MLLIIYSAALLSLYRVLNLNCNRKNALKLRWKYNKITHTRVRRSCRFPLYHVIIAFGLDPLLSHLISYLRSATNCSGVSKMSTLNGRTIKWNDNKIHYYPNEINQKQIEMKTKREFRFNCKVWKNTISVQIDRFWWSGRMIIMRITIIMLGQRQFFYQRLRIRVVFEWNLASVSRCRENQTDCFFLKKKIVEP